MGGNQLAALPDALGTLGSLKHLNAMNNQVGGRWLRCSDSAASVYCMPPCAEQPQVLNAINDQVRAAGGCTAQILLLLGTACCHALGSLSTKYLNAMNSQVCAAGGCCTALPLGSQRCPLQCGMQHSCAACICVAGHHACTLQPPTP